MVSESGIVAVGLRVQDVEVVLATKLLRSLTEAALGHLVFATLRSREYPAHLIARFTIVRARIGK